MGKPRRGLIYDRWLKNDRVSLIEEPPGLERRFRALTRSRQASPKVWGDAYIAAFAEASQLTLVTFDRAFRRKLKPLLYGRPLRLSCGRRKCRCVEC